MNGIAEDRARGRAWADAQRAWFERKERQFHRRMLVVQPVERVFEVVRSWIRIPRRRAIRRARRAARAPASAGDPAPSHQANQLVGFEPACGVVPARAFSYPENETAG